MKNTLIAVLGISALLLAGCDSRHHRHHKKPTHETIKTYRVHVDNSNDWLYWYMLYDNNTRQYYAASSPTPVTSSGYSGLNWVKSAEKPAQIEKEGVEELEDVDAEVEQLGDIAEDIEADYDSLDSMEGVPDGSETDSSTDSSDSGSDSGVGDSGGGDSGGGDGGGGGGE